MKLYALCLLAGLDHRSRNQSLAQAPPSPHSADTTQQHKLSSGEGETLRCCRQLHKPRALCRKPKLEARLLQGAPDKVGVRQGSHKRGTHSKAKLSTVLQNHAGSHCCLCWEHTPGTCQKGPGGIRPSIHGLVRRGWWSHSALGWAASTPVLGQFWAPQRKM